MFIQIVHSLWEVVSCSGNHVTLKKGDYVTSFEKELLLMFAQPITNGRPLFGPDGRELLREYFLAFEEAWKCV